jgi:hypothetical protein
MANRAEMTEDVYIVLSAYERGTVHAIQSRKPGALPINWKAMSRYMVSMAERPRLGHIHMRVVSHGQLAFSRYDYADNHTT